MTPRPDPASHVRPPRPGDGPALAALAGELGYPTVVDALLGRLAALHPTDSAVMVATDAADLPIGWCHVELRRSLLSPLNGLIAALVVAEEHRSQGVGTELLAAAERWARARGCRHMVVATRVACDRAHAFYRREGYEIGKSSYFLGKRLDMTVD